MKWFLLLVCLGGLVWGSTVFWARFRPAPEEALRRFYAQLGDGKTAEDQLMCPLILAGQAACPVIIRDVAEQYQPLRRYAIAALGNLPCPDAAPILYKILQDAGEKDYFRGDALEALWLVDQPAAETVAESQTTRPDHLGVIAKWLLRRNPPDTMGYWDAVLCLHK